MMSHRLALERSSIMAGFAGHGGTMIQLGNNLDAEKKRFSLQSMPLYTTGGTDDSWFEMSKTAHKSWSMLNECSSEEPMTVLTLSGGKLSVARKFVNSSCKNNVKVVRLEIVNGTHIQDSRMAKLSYEFLKSFTRSGSREALPPVPEEVIGLSTSAGYRCSIIAAFTSIVFSTILTLPV